MGNRNLTDTELLDAADRVLGEGRTWVFAQAKNTITDEKAESILPMKTELPKSSQSGIRAALRAVVEMMTPKRANGLHWVRAKSRGGWEVGEYHAVQDRWYLLGDAADYHDNDFDEIGPQVVSYVNIATGQKKTL